MDVSFPKKPAAPRASRNAYSASRWAPRPPAPGPSPYYDPTFDYSHDSSTAWAGPPGLEYPLDIPSYVDPRMPTGSEPEYLASCLDSFYYQGMSPMLPDLSDEWSHPMQNHLHGGWEEQELATYDRDYTRSYATVGAQETHSEYGKEGSSNCSTDDTDQVKGDFPTKGSAKHHLGLCKPCAFVFKNGCNSGWDCEFCHICEPGEKKRRKKERKQIRRQKVV